MSQTCDQQRFTISEVAADWHKPIRRQDPRWRISAILDFRGPIIGSLKSTWACVHAKGWHFEHYDSRARRC